MAQQNNLDVKFVSSKCNQLNFISMMNALSIV